MRDSFCRRVTTMVADKLPRRWIGIDIADTAIKLVRQRLERERGWLGEPPDHRTSKDALYGQPEGGCDGYRVQIPFRHFVVDLGVTRAERGTDRMENQTICPACNSDAGTGSQAELVAQQYAGVLGGH